MPRLITGMGSLKIGDSVVGSVEYKIHVSSTSARGSLWAAPVVLMQCFESSNVNLTLEDGRALEIVVTNWAPGQHADFHVNTPLS